ncbi:MAG TPA: hypothetical protein VHT73_14590 [Thermodesulfobacteriota bacterium]|nr:hypothetical protein [Thermodesulfobacteriota bacterium]
MRKILLSSLIVTGLAFGGAGLLSCENVNQTREAEQTEKAPEQRSGTQAQQGTNTQQETETQNQVTGEIIEVKDDSLKVEDESGTTHTFDITDQQMLEGLQVGDQVTVELEKGEINSIEKAEQKT